MHPSCTHELFCSNQPGVVVGEKCKGRKGCVAKGGSRDEAVRIGSDGDRGPCLRRSLLVAEYLVRGELWLVGDC